MTNWDWFRSFVILVVAMFLVQRLFLLDFFEAFTLIMLMAVCVFHTMDIRDHIYNKVNEKRRKRDLQ